MQLRRVSLTREQLQALPDADRRLFVLLGHILNEVNALDKLGYLCSLSIDGRKDWEDKANAAQGFVVIRVLAGKLNEAWQSIQESYFKTKLALCFQDHIGDGALQSLLRLKKRFSQKNSLQLVRNEFAFHFDMAHAGAAIPEDATREDLSIYLHEDQPGSCLYYYADYLINRALIDAISPEDPDAALGIFLTDLRAVVDDLNNFALAVLHAILELRLGKAALAHSGSIVHSSNSPSARRKRLPYFIQLP